MVSFGGADRNPQCGDGSGLWRDGSGLGGDVYAGEGVVNEQVPAHTTKCHYAPCLQSTCEAEYQQQPFRVGTPNDIVS
eukprot:2814193-Prymnesium_polylepis.1